MLIYVKITLVDWALAVGEVKASCTGSVRLDPVDTCRDAINCTERFIWNTIQGKHLSERDNKDFTELGLFGESVHQVVERYPDDAIYHTVYESTPTETNSRFIVSIRVQS